MPMALRAQRPAAQEYPSSLLRFVELQPNVGTHSPRAVCQMPRTGGARHEPHRRHHRQPEREERRKRGARIDPPGYDAGKKVMGKKRHVLVDTLGLLLHAVVHPADVQDRDGGILLLSTLFGIYPFLEKLFADSAYSGRFFDGTLSRVLPQLKTEIVKRSDQAKGFVVLPKRW